MNDLLGLISRWLHIIPALVMVGGVVFMRCCLPASGSSRQPLFEVDDEARRKWSRLVMASTLLLLVSGLYNSAMKAIGYELSMTYNLLLLVNDYTLYIAE